jgi:hypothetical protein
MQLRRGYLLLGLLATLSLQNKAVESQKATIIDTGSTNRPGLQVTLDASGSAKVELRGAKGRAIRLDSNQCKRFMQTLQSATPLHALPAAHCMKSVSFGSRLFIEYNGERSPDLSCPVQGDPRVDTLKRQAAEILAAAKTASRLLDDRNVSTTPHL